MWLVSTGAIAGNLPFRLNPGEYVVGRSKKAQIVINDLTVSKLHAKLLCGSKSVTVRDLASHNGTFINEQPAGRAAAEIGSRIRFGSVLCLLSPTAMIPAEDGESTFSAPIGRDSTMDVKGLTPAQQDVLRLVLRGMDETEISRRLDRSWHTIHSHLKAIFKHFDVHTRAELIAGMFNRDEESRRL